MNRMNVKVTIKAGVWKKRRRCWWVRCVSCDVSFHVHPRHWGLALEEACKHVGGKKHQNKLKSKNY